MQGYGVHDVERLIGLPRTTIRALVASGIVSPARGERNAWRFSFQDLIVLRTAQALAEAHVPPRQITRSVKELRRHLPETMPLSGLRIAAVADRVVVREGATHWQADSGQYLLQFEGDPAHGGLNVVAGTAPTPASVHSGQAADAAAERTASEWLVRGVELEEEGDLTRAMDAYEKAIEADSDAVDARINLGRLWHEAGKLEAAEAQYREALRREPADPTLLYNLGVVLQDLGREGEAIDAYEAAVREDDHFADAYFNLAQLCDRAGRKQEVIRYLARYRQLRRPSRW